MKEICVINDPLIIDIIDKKNIMIGDSIRYFSDMELREAWHRGHTMYIPTSKDYIVIYVAKSGYYERVSHKGYGSYLKRSTNFTLEVINKVIFVDYNKIPPFEYMYEVTVKCENKSINLTLTTFELENLKTIIRKITQHMHVVNYMESDVFRCLASRLMYNASDCPTIYETKRAGYNLINDTEIFITSNASYLYANSKKLEKPIRLSSYSTLQPKFITKREMIVDENLLENLNLDKTSLGKDFVKKITLKLFKMLDNVYSNRIEPFLVISCCFIFPFLKKISKDFEGIPIIILYGEAASGKTNLLRLIASAYGLDHKALLSGMDTTAAILQSFNSYSNIPMLIDEVEINSVQDKKNLIKAVYGQSARKKYNHQDQINTTLFMNTNNKFLYDLEYRNRCIELNFEQTNFSCDEAEKFNDMQKCLSYITGYIIRKISYDKIKQMIKTEEKTELLSKISDIRMKRNIAIAITGLRMLIEIIDDEDLVNFSIFESRLIEYINETQSIYEEDVERFIIILRELLENKSCKLKINQDYKIDDNGVHLLIGKKNKRFEQIFKHKFKTFFDNVKPLELKNYVTLLKKYGAKMNNAYYSEPSLTFYGLYLPFDKFEELNFLQKSTPFFASKKSEGNKKTLDENKNFELPF